MPRPECASERPDRRDIDWQRGKAHGEVVGEIGDAFLAGPKRFGCRTEDPQSLAAPAFVSVTRYRNIGEMHDHRWLDRLGRNIDSEFGVEQSMNAARTEAADKSRTDIEAISVSLIK